MPPCTTAAWRQAGAKRAILDPSSQQVSPSSHLTPVGQRMVADPEGTTSYLSLNTGSDNEAPATASYVPVPVSAGDAVLLHGAVWHRSARNTSGSQRLAYTMHVVSGNAEYLEDNWLQRPEHLPFEAL